MSESFTKQDGLAVQADQLQRWQNVLIPKAYQMLVAECVKRNNTVNEAKHNAGHDVWRGTDMENFVLNDCMNQCQGIAHTSVTYLVTQMGYWGKGSTLQMAAENCMVESGTKSGPAIASMILGDQKVYIDNNGYVIRAAGSTNIFIGRTENIKTFTKITND